MAVKHYQFCAQPHHELHIGGEVYYGGDEFDLDEELAATLPNVVEHAQESEVLDSGNPGDLRATTGSFGNSIAVSGSGSGFMDQSS